jgi:KDO2-lipid IV(A) lauroyltransferase
MADPSYSYRSHALASERLYQLRPEGLSWSTSRQTGFIPYRDIHELCIFKARFFGSSASYWNCVLRPRSGGTIRLGAASRVGFNSIEDRTSAYIPFIKDLEARVAAANPQLRVAAGRHWLSAAETIAGRIAVWIFLRLRRLNLKRLPAAAAWVMRRVGPRLRGHRVARAQVAAVFPDKSPAEIEAVLAGMWDNLARVGAEYLNLGQLTGDAPGNPERSRILIDSESAARLQRLRDAREPVLFFTAHLGNWELNATTISALGSDLAVVYRAPRSGPIADEMVKTRAAVITDTIAAGPDTPMRIRQLLKRGWMVGMLVDQYYADGVEVMLFDRPTKINPLFARFVRLFDCSVHGVRIIRLSDGRFRFEMSEPVELPRDTTGKIDVNAAMQVIVSIIEGWVREHPEQWMWLHRHWR